MQQFSEQNIFIFLLEIFLLLGLARGLGELFRKWKQPALTAEILVGIFLGPTLFGRFLPRIYNFVFPADNVQQYMLQTIAWLGLMFFLLEAGLKMDFSSAWRHRGKALVIALTDIIIPMCFAFTLCIFLPQHYLVNPQQRVLFAFFMATVMTISAMPTAVRALSDLDIIKTDLGFLIMSALSVNEIIGWMVFTVILGFVIHLDAQVWRVAVIFISTIGISAFCLTWGRRFANAVISKFKAYGFPEPASSLTFICLLGFASGAVFQKIGINALLGFFIAGIMAGEAKALPERTRQVISQMVYAIFIPLFFAGIGLRLDFSRHLDLFLILFISAVGIIGKFAGAWLGGIFARLPKVNRLPVAIAHTPGGSMEIVIGMLALQYRLISEPVFVAIVCGGIISSVILGPWLKYSLTRRKEISILEFFTRRAVLAEIKSTDRDAAIHELSAAVSEQENMPVFDTIYSAVVARENLMGTAIEDGIALPHARLPGLSRSVIAFGRCSSGIDWDSPDGKPIQLIFLILTPKEDDDAQIQILRIIARLVSSGDFKNKLLNAPDNQKLWEVISEAFSQHHIVRNKNLA